MTRTSKEIREEIAKLHEELCAAEDAEAKAKYSNLEGKWIKFNDLPWYEEEEDRPRIHTYAKLACLKSVTPVSNDTDRVSAFAKLIIEFDPDYYGGVKFVVNENFDIETYNSTVDFYSNRYMVVTDADVIKAVNEATVAFEVKTDMIKSAIIREEQA